MDGVNDRPNKSQLGAKSLWCPFATIMPTEMPTHGEYAGGYPKGAIVHYSAGVEGAGGINYGAKQGYSYMVVDRKGSIFQATPLNRWGSHAGESTYPGLTDHVSNQLVGIEVDSYGLLSSKLAADGRLIFSSWCGVSINAGEVRQYDAAKDNVAKGYYQMFTAEQEKSLTRLLLWLKANNPDVFDLNFVLGHDEVAPGRKTDPGGALYDTMPGYRAALQKLWAERALP